MNTCLIVLLLAGAMQFLPAGELEFVVIGDTRPRFESENFRIFESLIPKINAAKPAFVINLGDLIYGYAPLRKETQWDKYQQVIQALQPPYYQLPGNHDTYSKAARKIYGRRFGKFYQSFDAGDCHFVLLDNTEAERWGYLGPAQLEWLKADLKATKAQSVFVFLHFPIWEPERVASQYYEFWSQTLHPLFKASRVRAVFAGHFHSYGPTREFDGIRYFITGGGGAELRPAYRESGGDYHFLKVKVTDDRYDLRVVTERGELTDAEADVTGGLLFADKHASRIGIQEGNQNLRTGGPCTVVLENPYAEPLSGKAEWTFDASAFSVEPKSVSVGVQPGGKQEWTFTLKALQDTASLQSLPRLEFNVASGGSRHRFHRELLVLREMKTPYRTVPLVLDGRLDNWGRTAPLRLGAGTQTDAEVRTAHGAEVLYLAVTLPAGNRAESDESAFPDELQVGIASRFSDAEFGGDVIRFGLTTDGNVVRVKDRTPGRKPGAAVPGVNSACRTEGNRTFFEIAVPYRLLKPLKAGGEGRLILNLSFPTPDGDEEATEPADPRRNSFFYQVRYGGDALVPTHFVELSLEPKKK